MEHRSDSDAAHLPRRRAAGKEAKKRSAVAAYGAAAQAYQRAVLESLQQVVYSLRVLEADALVLQARSTALDQSNASYIIARQRFEVGGISEVSLLEARRQNLQTALDPSMRSL